MHAAGSRSNAGMHQAAATMHAAGTVGATDATRTATIARATADGAQPAVRMGGTHTHTCTRGTHALVLLPSGPETATSAHAVRHETGHASAWRAARGEMVRAAARGRRARGRRRPGARWRIALVQADESAMVTVRTRKFMTNRLLQRRQMVRVALAVWPRGGWCPGHGR